MAPEDFVDAYAVLGVPPTATQAELVRAHRRLVRRHHPDLAAPGDSKAATRRVQDINMAYGLVRDPAARESYDRLRRLHRARQPAPADQWDAAVRAAGRWAGAWWRRNRTPLRRAAVRAHLRVRRAGADVAGRVLWLATCLGWAAAGFAMAIAAQRILGVSGTLAPLAGVGAGALLGSQRGWHRRLRLAGLPPARPAAARAGLVAAGAALLAALGADAALVG